MSVARTDPGAGDPSRIRDAASIRRAKVFEVRRGHRTIRRAMAAASGAAWTGVAQGRFESTLDEALPDLAALADSLEATVTALQRYADAVAAIQDEQDALERRRARLEDEVVELEALRDRERDLADLFVGDEFRERADAYDHELAGLRPHLERVDDEWEMLVRRRERADADFVEALSSRAVRGSIAALERASADCEGTDDLLGLLSGMSATDLRLLAAAHPELLERMARASPAEAAEWWAALGVRGGRELSSQQSLLVDHLPAFVGALGGLPAAVRVRANRIVAMERLAAVRSQLTETRMRGFGPLSNQPYAGAASAAHYLETLRRLELEASYLERVQRGEVQLYLYEPNDGRIIEMFGDPDTARSIMSFIPGTNTNVESFYSSTDEAGITALTRWQVARAIEPGSVAGFVVMQGDFPQTGDLWGEGPQHNWYADVLGRRYAEFADELDVVARDAAVVSVEHSFGSAVGGKAETAGADFAARYLLAGIGMTSDWQPNSSTDYFAAQGPTDINRALDGVEVGSLGYEITPAEVAGIHERASGLDISTLARHAPLAPLHGAALIFNEALDQHNAIISPEASVNETVRNDLAGVLNDVGQR